MGLDPTSQKWHSKGLDSSDRENKSVDGELKMF